MALSVIKTDIVRISNGISSPAGDVLAIEEPLEIQICFKDEGGKAINRKISVTMRTPGCDKALALGFLFTEGILRHREQVQDVVIPEENKVQVWLIEGLQPELQHMERNFYTTSSCGVCGKSSIEAIRTVSCFDKPDAAMQLQPELLYSLPEKLRAQQEIFDSTGGLHAAALFDTGGNFLSLNEDVGRHNALDKVIGTAFLKDMLPLDNVVLLLSGRASFELVQKAVMAGIPVIAAVGAPSSLAVSLAAEQGLTLVGFLRGERFNIYSGQGRIINRTT